MTRCRNKEDGNSKRMKIADESETKRMEIALVEKKAFFVISILKSHFHPQIFFRLRRAISPCKSGLGDLKSKKKSRLRRAISPCKSCFGNLKISKFSRLRRAISPFKSYFGNIKISKFSRLG